MSGYETRAADLWVSNEEPLYRAAVALAERAIDLDEVAKGIRALFEEMPPTSDIRTDIGRLDLVDWEEVAAYFWEEFGEQEKDLGQGGDDPLVTSTHDVD